MIMIPNLYVKIGNYIVQRLDKYELILAVIFLLAMILKIVFHANVSVIIMLDLTALSIAYFFSAFAVIDETRVGAIESFVVKLAFWSCSVVLMGILFTLNHWTGSATAIRVGGFSLLISLVVMLFSNYKKPDLKFFSFRWLLRVAVILILGLSLHYASPNAFAKVGLIKKVEITTME
jgi:hypothetical protein